MGAPFVARAPEHFFHGCMGGVCCIMPTGSLAAHSRFTVMSPVSTGIAGFTVDSSGCYRRETVTMRYTYIIEVACDDTR